MEKSLNLDALRSFVVFSELLNFTHAAEQLHISQPALFVKINDLSDTLGVPLYRKVGRRLELTEKGKQVARFGRELSGKTRAFLEELHTGKGTQPVVLAAGEGAYLYLLGEPIREFLRRGKTPLQLLSLNREGIIEAILAGKAHLGVAALETRPTAIESQLLCKADQMLVMPEAHPLSRKKKIVLKDLEGSRLIVPPADRPHRQMLASFLQSENVNWEVAVEAAGWELMLHFVQLGLGVAIVNSIVSVPRGLKARVMPELPKLSYHVFHLAGAAKERPVARLKQRLLSTASLQQRDA